MFLRHTTLPPLEVGLKIVWIRLRCRKRTSRQGIVSKRDGISCSGLNLFRGVTRGVGFSLKWPAIPVRTNNACLTLPAPINTIARNNCQR